MSEDSRLESLVDLFPAVPRSELAARLNSCDNLDDLVEQLLSESHIPTQNDLHCVPQNVHQSELQFMFPHIDPIKISECLELHNNDFQAAADALMEPVEPPLVDLCGLPPQTTDPYVEKYQGDKIRALIDILATFRRQTKAWSSRVQRTPLEPVYVPSYTYKSLSPEAAELDELIMHNKQLQKLNYAFLKKLLVFFEGNIYKVTAAAEAVVNAKMEKHTFDHTLGLTAETFTVPKTSLSDVLRAGPTQSNTVELQFQSPGRNTRNRYTSVTKPLPIVRTSVDLHGYTVKEATDTVEEALNSWWQEEMRLREIGGHFERYGRKCQFVEPLSIVTGRGLHSQGGPKIRGLVVRLLTRSGFIYDEDVGRLVVNGKK